MKNLMLILALICISISITEAQIKRQYRDQTTMVVVKDEAGMTDMDILNANFDLAEVSMGDVIRITTEKDRPVIVENTYASAEVPVEEVIVEDQEPTIVEPVEVEEEIAAIVVEELIEEKQEEIVEAKPQLVSNTVKKVPNRTETSKGSKGSSSSSKSFKKKKRKKRVYLKKRKKVKRKRFNSCYAF